MGVAENQLSVPVHPIQLSESLQTLNLNMNNLIGTLHDSFHVLHNLKVFRCSNNKLTSTLPHSLFVLSNLRALDLGSNKFVGSLPDLSTLRSIEMLELWGNRLTGILE